MVTEISKQKHSYEEAFRALQDDQTLGRASWLERLRENAMARFEDVGFPTVKDEEWKYTNVATIARTDFSLWQPSDTNTAKLELGDFGLEETRDSQLVFVNGVFRAELSSVTGLAEVAAGDLSLAINDERYSEVARTHLARHADVETNGFVALNTAFTSQGAFVYIPKGVAVKSPLHLLFLTDPSFKNKASFPRVLVVAEENSEVTLIENYLSTHEAPYFTNAVVEVVLKSGARVEHYKVQRESTEAFHIATTAADLGANSSYNATTITFGAQLSRHDIQVTMDNEGAECWVDGLYLVAGNQHTDTHSVIDHRKPHCTSHQLYKGILDGQSRAVFNGKIFVRHDAQKTDAMQTNKNLLLSNEARVDTKPQLEILADDVKCAHGAAVGQIDDEELFYLKARGIHPDLARNLLTYGFAEEVIDKIKIDSIKAQLDETVLNRLNARLEV